MARATPPESDLSTSLKESGGLGQFRTVAQRAKETGDGPFGPPTPKQPERQTKAKAQSPKRDPRPHDRIPSASVTTDSPGRPPKTESPSANATPSPFTENVTVPLTEALRDQSEELARALNRNRTVRKKRLTRNSVIRVALRCFLDEFPHRPDEPPNSEEELLEAARALRRTK